MIAKTWITILPVALLAAGSPEQAQKKQAVFMAMSANGKQAVSWEWKQKVTVIRKGNPLDPIIEQIRFDTSGQLQRMTLVKPEEKRMGPFRARKAADIKETVQEVMQFARLYASPQQLRQAIQKGELWEGPGSLRIQARSVVHPLDEMHMQISGSTYLASRIDCRTQYEGSPVAIAIDYGKLPNGPSMMTRMTVQIPGESIVVNVESFDFVRLAVPRVP